MKVSVLSIIIISLFFILSCKKDNSDDNTQEGQGQLWEMEINVDITDPDPSPFKITGDVDILIDGNEVTFTGSYVVGNLTFKNIVFTGVLNGNKVDMTTNEYQVGFDSQGIHYTEVITWDMATFTVSLDSASGNGIISAVKTPGNTIESGTFTFSAWKVK